MLNIGWFSTGRGEGSQGLLRFIQERILREQLDARIQFVFSNRTPGEAEGSDRYFQLVQSYSLPLLHLSSAQFRRDRGGPIARHREEYDRRVMELLGDRQPDICVLAGYMLIVGGAMCRSYSLLNLHPALPDGPTGTWQEVIWSLIEKRAGQTGAMMHLATEDVDRGPVVSHCTADLTAKEFERHWRELEEGDLDQIKARSGEEFPLFQLIRQAEYEREPYLLLETLRAIAAGRVVIRGGQVLDRSGLPLSQTHPRGLDLDRDIDQAIAQDLSQDLAQDPSNGAG
jgi:folate-dependent phosphoribosylglycinamide formyltransferase PurN